MSAKPMYNRQRRSPLLKWIGLRVDCTVRATHRSIGWQTINRIQPQKGGNPPTPLIFTAEISFWLLFTFFFFLNYKIQTTDLKRGCPSGFAHSKIYSLSWHKNKFVLRTLVQLNKPGWVQLHMLREWHPFIQRYIAKIVCWSIKSTV